MTWLAPAWRAISAFSELDAVPITVAPRLEIIWQRSCPTPPAAACTKAVSPDLTSYSEAIK